MISPASNNVAVAFTRQVLLWLDRFDSHTVSSQPAEHLSRQSSRSTLTGCNIRVRDKLNACLAGLLVAELHLDDRPESGLLVAAGEVIAEAGPKTKAALSAMSRGLHRRTGMGTWDAVVAGLIGAGIVAPTWAACDRATR